QGSGHGGQAFIQLVQSIGRNVVGQQQTQPIQKFRGGRFLLQTRDVTQGKEGVQGAGQDVAAQIGVVHGHDLFHGLALGKADVMEETAAQEGVGQVFFVIGSNDDQGTMTSLDGLASFVNMKLHAVQFLQQVVGELDVGLVDFVDQNNSGLFGLKGLPQRALHNVVANVADFFIAQLGVAQTRDSIIFIQALMRLGGGLDMPLQQGAPQGASHFQSQQCLAGSRLAFDQQ